MRVSAGGLSSKVDGVLFFSFLFFFFFFLIQGGRVGRKFSIFSSPLVALPGAFFLRLEQRHFWQDVLLAI